MLTNDQVDILIEEMTWRINGNLDEFPLVGDRVTDVFNEDKTSAASLIKDVEHMTRLLGAYRSLLLMRQAQKDE